MAKNNKKKEELTWEYLKQVLDYNEHTGIWVWKITTGRVKAGDTAGTLHPDGYNIIRIRYKLNYAHVLAWFYMTGERPKKFVEHKDQNPSNNIWTNLRLATNSENMANRGKQKNNTSGLKGVSWHKARGNWRAKIRYKGKDIHLGSFDCKIEAGKAYVRAAEKYQGEYANHNSTQKDTK